MTAGDRPKLDPELWPQLPIAGNLETAEREWLHTNGTGAYAMSTLALMHTRRYHGLLVAPLDPPLRRHVIVNQADTTVSVGQRAYRLSTHQFPGVAATPGYRLLESFSQDPLPRWVYRLDRDALTTRLCLARGFNTTIISYTWHGSETALLSIQPLFAMRSIHDVTREHGAMMQRVSMRHGVVEIQPIPDLPSVTFQHSGVFMGSPDWWRRFEYPTDRKGGVPHQEDLWTPGMFEIELPPGQTRYLQFGLGEMPKLSPAQCMEESEREILALDPGPDVSWPVRRLSIAAEQFRANRTEIPATLAGFPWLSVATRDALVSLPGLYLIEGQLEQAKQVLRVLLSNRRGGLLTTGWDESGAISDTRTADASLWLFDAAAHLVDKTGVKDDFVKGELYPSLVEIFERVVQGPREVVWLTPEGLVANGAESGDEQLPMTWMDSRADGVAATLRRGLAVELQGLWCRACRTLQDLAERLGDTQQARNAERAADAVAAAFGEHFWCKDTRYPYDCLGEELLGGGQLAESACRDAAVRPNALIALAVAPELFAHWQAASIVERCRERLLTPAGMRTLEPSHPDYRGDFRGLMWERRAAYHQGTCWVYLLGFYARAAIRVEPNDFELRIELRHSIERLIDSGSVLGQVGQVASGDPPFPFGGCPAQAWSVSELLRVLVENLDS